MKVVPRLCIAMSLAIGATPASAQVQSLKETLEIGTLLGVARPEGFSVEDRRGPEAKVASQFRQTYKAPFKPFGRPPVPLAKYVRNLGDGELNVAALDLLAEKLIERYGDQLRGKRLTVHEFSYRLEQRVNRAQGMTVTAGGSGSLAADIALSVIGSMAGTAMLQGKGIDLTLQVNIDAELDGNRIQVIEDPITLAGAGEPARITRYALDKFLARLEPQHEPPPAEPSAVEPSAAQTNSPEDKKPD